MAHGLILSDWKIPCTMKKKSILFVLAAICLPLAVSAQKEREITLNEAIAMARMQSVDAAVALNELKTSYWEYRTFRADLLPEINLKGTLPNYNKSYGSYQNPDGSYSFVRNSALGLSGELSIDQNIWLTGGQLSLTSSLDYLKQLGNSGDRHLMSVPVTLKLTQPILGVNNVKWNRRIEPVRYAEAKAEFITATEEVTMRAITYYFDLLLAKETLGTARQNLTNANQLYEVAIAKRKMGQISENELLQLKLSALNAKALINLGGNVLCLGDKPEGTAFRIGVQKPFGEATETLTICPIEDQSLVSSGTYERFFQKDGRLYHHILNPKTGYPYDNGLTAVTIRSDDSLTGDALSTTVFALGEEKGLELLNRLDGVEGFVVREDLSIHKSENF